MEFSLYKGGYDAAMSDLIGRIFTRVNRAENCDGHDELHFECAHGIFKLLHYPDCCESVAIESITGDLNDLVGVPIVLAEEVTSGDDPPGYVAHEFRDESFTWTFYKLATIKGYVDIRWLGESNGYYSEGVDLIFIPARW